MDNFSTIILLLLRVPVILFGLVLLVNLLGGFYRERSDGKLDVTRRALFWLVLAIVLDAITITIAYAHGLFGTISTQQWLGSVEWFLILNRALYAYAVIRFWRLFCCNKNKQKG
jgi:hypothetical protein